MTTVVIARVQVEGFHVWPQAPRDVAFLRNRHRHVFHIRAAAPVTHPDRDVEFIVLGRRLWAYLVGEYGNPCEFGAQSCESLAAQLVEEFDLAWAEVYEDGENGARVDA